MRISTIVIMFMMISLLAIGMSTILNDFTTQYGVDAADDLSFINRSNALNQEIQQMKSDVQNTTQTGEDVFNIAFTVASGGINAVFRSFSFIDIGTDMINDMMGFALIPDWVSTLISALISIALIAGVIFALLKVKW